MASSEITVKLDPEQMEHLKATLLQRFDELVAENYALRARAEAAEAERDAASCHGTEHIFRWSYGKQEMSRLCDCGSFGWINRDVGKPDDYTPASPSADIGWDAGQDAE